MFYYYQDALVQLLVLFCYYIDKLLIEIIGKSFAGFSIFNSSNQSAIAFERVKPQTFESKEVPDSPDSRKQ